MTGLSAGMPLVMKSVMAAVVMVTVMCAMSDAASVNKRDYFPGHAWGNMAHRQEESTFKESKEWKNKMEHSTNQFGHGPGSAPSYGNGMNQDYGPPHGNGMNQDYGPPHGNGMNQGYVPHHGNGKTQDYVPPYRNGMTQDYVPPHGNGMNGLGWTLVNNNNNDNYYNPATGQHRPPQYPQPPAASHRPQPSHPWDWMKNVMEGIHGNNPKPNNPVATYPGYPPQSSVPYPPPRNPSPQNVPYPPPSVHNPPRPGTYFSYNKTETKTLETTHQVHGHVPFPPKVVNHQPPQPWYGNQVRTTPTPYYPNNRDYFGHNPRYTGPGHVALAADYGRHPGRPSDVAGFY